MIKLVLNGYYRSGTTILWWAMKRSNPEMLHLFEPLSPALEEDDLSLRSHKLHGAPVGTEYNRKEFDQVKNNFFKRRSRLLEIYKHRLKKSSKVDIDVLPTNLEEVAPLFDLLNGLEIPVIVQPNNCHFILRDISERYGCKFIHIIRNPIDTWLASTVDKSARKGVRKRFLPFLPALWLAEKLVKKSKLALDTLARIYMVNRSFFLEPDFELVTQYFDYDRNLVKDYLDKRLVVWAFCNYEAWKQAEDCKDGMIIYYEQLVKNPEYWFEKMEEFGGVRFSKEYAKEIKPYITHSEKLKDLLIDRLEQLEIFDMVRKFYPPERWFG